MFGSRFSIFGTGASADKVENSAKSEVFPGLKLRSDKDVYRPGDPVVVTIEICSSVAQFDCSLLIERLSFEIIGLQKLDAQWFSTQKPIPGSKQRRGEHVFMDCSVQSIVSNQIISSGATKSYVVRSMLPTCIPPSYKGATIRYMYYVKSTLLGRWLSQENGRSHKESLRDQIEMETRVPLQVWVTQKTNGMLMEEGQNGQNDENTPVTMERESLDELVNISGKWQKFGSFHLKFERWNNSIHGRPAYVRGYGGWISIKNLPLDYWCKQTFEAIGKYFGGLESIAMEILNLIKVLDAIIKVKENLCGFVPATIEVSNEKRGSIYLNFGDISTSNPPSKVKGDLFESDFTNPIDLIRLNEVKCAEGIYCDPLNSKFNFLFSSNRNIKSSRSPGVFVDNNESRKREFKFKAKKSRGRSSFESPPRSCLSPQPFGLLELLSSEPSAEENDLKKIEGRDPSTSPKKGTKNDLIILKKR
ncbi:uncharacterized protein LOC120091119 isoform X2 [Benincasa hispida]|uniref:uncharacterized protein LOC120091119 isoform X2 n=1 Tax=Benincasa hispida TaxID=102211 RepID=UPI0019022377|nr:uncharacterized protein LOC120091119 isoform X2 [Benincasa hispida]